MPENTDSSNEEIKQASSETPKPKKESARKSPKRATKKAKPKSTAATGVTAAPWTFPKVPLEKAIELAQAIEEKNAGKPIQAEYLAPFIGFNKSSDWRFLDILRAANQYGILEGSCQPPQVSTIHK